MTTRPRIFWQSRNGGHWHPIDIHPGNLSLARCPEGARCIHITRLGTFTVAEAEHLITVLGQPHEAGRLLADLAAAVAPIKELRTMGGFDD